MLTMAAARTIHCSHVMSPYVHKICSGHFMTEGGVYG